MFSSKKTLRIVKLFPTQKKTAMDYKNCIWFCMIVFIEFNFELFFLLEKQLFSEANFRTLRLQLLDLGLCL